MPLSTKLREGTKVSHRTAETTPFIQAFFAAQVTVEAYRELLARLYQVYGMLEQSCEGHPALGTLHSSALSRTQALERDLIHYYGEDWRDHICPTPATQAYVERIRSVAGEWQAGLVAHHYTRYLGDLSGGQILKRIAIKAFKLTNGQGVAFYEFPGIPDIDQFKTEYRAKLDALPIEDEVAQKIVEEANHAFYLNTQLFAELQSD